MPLYRWRAVDDQGIVSAGEIEAKSHAEAIDRLRRQGCLAVAVEAVGAHLLPPGIRTAWLFPALGLLAAGMVAVMLWR